MLKRSKGRFLTSNKLAWIAQTRYGWTSAPHLGVLRPQASDPSAKDYGVHATRSKARRHHTGTHEAGDASHQPLTAKEACDAAKQSNYCRALIYASSGSRVARDWIAGLAGLTTSNTHLIEISLQYEATQKDLDNFIEDSKDNAGHASDCNAAHMQIRNCFLYDAIKAATYSGTDFTSEMKERVRQSAMKLEIPESYVDQVEELVLEENALMAEKYQILEDEISPE